jgi:GDPmannose 4,6-dehydratase
MLQVDEADDFVLATGETHPVREFVEKAFKAVEIDIIWTGEPGSVEEQGVNAADPTQVYVKVDPKYVNMLYV